MAEAQERPKVFISYSRKDLAAVEALRDALIAGGLDAYLDLHDILPGEPWRERLGKLIEAADTVVFALSPDSVASDIVDWEVNEAERLGKRILPVVIRDAEPNLIPGRIKRLNYIFIRNATEQTSGLAKLSGAIRTDINWIRTHTRLGELAADWDRSKRATEFLLRGTTLLSAESWISNLHPTGSAPTLLHCEYIQASRAEALPQAVRVGRAQVLVGLLIVALISGAGYLVWLNRNYLQFQTNLILDTYIPTVLSASTERELMPGRAFQECASCPQMIVVPAGEFLMGSPGEGADSERPQHSVRIEQAFAVAKFGVTFDQWDACIAHGGCTHHADDRGWGRGLIPVTDISWNDAQQYITWLSKQTNKHYRLLSEAEREYAARAGSNTKYPWGDDLGKGNANCPNGGSQWEDKQPAPVGSFPPNAFGVYDMIGNLWEWVEDNWHPNYDDAPQTGSVWAGGDSSQRVTRGGSYANTAGECYTAFRDFARPPDFRNYIFGIRVARSLNGL
jgi:formylglycine-generating enzyme required for sulfatase activity